MKYSLVLMVCCTVASTVYAAPVHIISSAIATGSIPGANNAMGGAPPADGMSTWDRIAVLKDVPFNLGGLGQTSEPCDKEKRSILEKRRRRGGSSSSRGKGLGSRIGSLFRSSKTHKSDSPSLDSSTSSSSLTSSTSSKATSGGFFSKLVGGSSRVHTQPTIMVPMAMESQRQAKEARERRLRRARSRMMRKMMHGQKHKTTEQEEKEDEELTKEEKKQLEEEIKKEQHAQKGKKGKKNSKRSIELPIADTVNEETPSSRWLKTLPVEEPVIEDF